MNVLEIVKAACFEKNETAPSTLIGSTDPNVLQLTYLLYAVGRDLTAAKYWDQLKRTHSFPTVAAQANYTLPTDFYAPVFDTQYNQDENEALVKASDSHFNWLQYGIASSTNEIHYRVFGRNNESQIQLFPTPDSIQTLSFDYISNAWIRAIAGSTWATTITLDTDVVAFDDDIMILGLKAKLAKERGLEFQSDMAAYHRKLEQSFARFEGAYTGSMAGKRKRQSYTVADGGWSI
jgi:hypothetical protein